MKILQIVCTYPPYHGGMGNVAFNFSRELIKIGHEVIVFSTQPKILPRQKPKELVYIKPLLRRGNGAFLPGIFNKINKFDIIYLHYPFFGTDEVLWFKKMIFRQKLPLVIHFHMDAALDSLILKSLKITHKIIRNSLFTNADAVVASSLDYVRHSSLSSFYDNNKTKFFEIPFGVDLKKFHPLDNQKNKKNFFLFVGALDKAHYFKGVKNLLKAFSKINNKKQKLVIIGDGDKRIEYEHYASSLKIDAQVEFKGRVNENELAVYYRNALALILPSTATNEAYGLVLLEAMASGTAVVASDLPGVRGVFAQGIDGFLTPADNVHELAKIMEALARNRKRVLDMGLSGRQRVLKNNNWQARAEQLSNLFESLI